MRGPSARLDPRYNAFRGDLADAALASRLFAPHYARALESTVGPNAAPLRAEPRIEAEELATLAPDEAYALLDVTGGWAWGYRMSDHLIGYIREQDLAHR